MRTLNLALRVVLIALFAVVAVEVGVKFAPRLATNRSPLTAHRSRPIAVSRQPSAVGSWPDWGGSQLSFANRSASGLIDSVKTASRDDWSRTQSFSGRTGGVLLRKKPGADYSLTMAMSSPRQPDRTALFDVPSTGRFRKELLPEDGDAEPPAADIPLYPQSRCRMQVGRGTACFIGFDLTPDSVEAVRSFYTSALSRLGWQRVVADPPGPVETFTKRNSDRAVVLQLRRQDSTTTRIGLVATSAVSREP